MIGLIAVASSATVWASDPGGRAPAGAVEARAGELERRIPWTGSRIAGTPEPPPPYTVELAFPRLKFAFPVVLVPAKGTNRLFVGGLKGQIVSFPNDPGCTKADLVFDFAKHCTPTLQRSMA